MKVGDKIIITKNKPRNECPVDYYYGGDLTEVKLGTKGTILDIDNIVIQCRLINNKIWNLHPDEISLININEEARQHDKRKTQ